MKGARARKREECVCSVEGGEGGCAAVRVLVAGVLVLSGCVAAWGNMVSFQPHRVNPLSAPRPESSGSGWSLSRMGLERGRGSSVDLSAGEAATEMGVEEGRLAEEAAEAAEASSDSGSAESEKARLTRKVKGWSSRLKAKGKKLAGLAAPPESEEETHLATARDVHELRRAVLQRRIPLKDVRVEVPPAAPNATTATAEEISRHPVAQIIAERMRTNSTPGSRLAGDESHVALAIEGGGMRGAVSAGMAAAIASLGLTDAIDSVYGSSAGTIVGAYMISRQMCVDVYTQVLPAAGPKFASQTRVLRNIGVGVGVDAYRKRRAAVDAQYSLDADRPNPAFVAVPSGGGGGGDGESGGDSNNDSNNDSNSDSLLDRASALVAKVPLLNRAPVAFSKLRPYFSLSPGMNLTFVLDGIMNADSGLRPFDMEAFRVNDAKQPLYAVSSTVRAGTMETVAFSSNQGDYWDIYVPAASSARPRAVRVAPGTASARIARRFIQPVLRPVRTVLASLLSRSRHALRRLMRRQTQPTAAAPVLAQPEHANATQAQQSSSSSSSSLFVRKKRRPIRRVKSFVSRRRRRLLRNVRKQTVQVLRQATACPHNTGRNGFYACLESSMLVPGAAGPPLKLLRSKHRQEANLYGLDNMTSYCFDAFCNEPIPYRSAVENGATHVLALRSRPDGCLIPTKPSTYEKIVAPVYFRLSFLPIVGDYFERQGSQFRYLEDVLTLDEGLAQGCQFPPSPHYNGVTVPPTQILLGTQNDHEIQVNPEMWNKAHLLPVVLPANTSELPSLTQDKDEVLAAVRQGYAAAFKMLAPIAGLNFQPTTLECERIAEMVFPNTDDDYLDIMENPVQVKGEFIDQQQPQMLRRRSFLRWISRKRQQRNLYKQEARRSRLTAAEVQQQVQSPGSIGSKEDSLDWLEAEVLLATLPGFQSGKFTHLAGGLRSQNETLNPNLF